MGTKPHLFLSQVANLIIWQETHSLSKLPRGDCHETPVQWREEESRGSRYQNWFQGRFLWWHIHFCWSWQQETDTSVKALLTPHGATEGKCRRNQREWGTEKGRDLSGPHRGGSGGELVHLFSCTPSSLALLWKYQCFLLEAEHFLLCRLSPLPWGLVLALGVGGREWSQGCLEVTPCENREHPAPSVPPFLGACLAERQTRVNLSRSILDGLGSLIPCRQLWV